MPPVRPSIRPLKRRAEYLQVAASGRRWITPDFILQALPDAAAAGTVAIGFTASRKVGGAVLRNRARRRLKEAARQVLPAAGTSGWAYVLVARAREQERGFERLLGDMRWALEKLASGADLKPGRPRRGSR